MNTLQVLTEPADRLACLTAAREHLAPGGELIFDVALPDAEEIVGHDGHGAPRRAAPRPRQRGDPGALGLVRPLGARHPHPASSRSAWSGGRASGPPSTVLRRHRVHLFSPEEIGALLERAGLEPIEVLGDFDGSPVLAGSERQIHRCRAAP